MTRYQYQDFISVYFCKWGLFCGCGRHDAGADHRSTAGDGGTAVDLSLVVIIIGGIGSVRGAFIAAIIVGLVDTLGRVFLPSMLRLVVDQATADGAGPAVASMLVYILMAVVLIFRPTGLFPAKG